MLKKIDAQVQNIREKQDTISATKSLEHIRPENIKKGPLNNALDVLSGQSAGVNVTTNGTDRLAMLKVSVCVVPHPLWVAMTR